MPNGYRAPRRCSCVYSPASPNLHGLDTTSMSFTYNPPWDPNWSDTEIHQEECRRLCWGALTLYANHSAQCMAFHEDPLNLKLSEPSNVSNYVLCGILRCQYSFFSSSLCYSFRGRRTNVYLVISKFRGNPPKTQSGHFIVAACFCGIACCGTKMKRSMPINVLDSSSTRSTKPLPSRTPLICMSVTWTPA